MIFFVLFLSQFVNCQHEDCGVSRSCMLLPDGCIPGGREPCNWVMWNTLDHGINVTLHGENTANAGDWAGGRVRNIPVSAYD